MEPVHVVFDLEEGTSSTELQQLAEVLARKDIDMIINLPMRKSNMRTGISSFKTYGYHTRRLAVEYAVPLITDVKCTKLLVEVCNRASNVLKFSPIDNLHIFLGHVPNWRSPSDENAH